MTNEEFIAKTPTVSNETIAACMMRTAAMLEALEKNNKIPNPVASIVCVEAARRLAILNTPQAEAQAMKLIEDLAKRVIEIITPENVALGHTWLRRKLTEVIAAN